MLEYAQILKFLIENHYILLAPPLYGNLRLIYCVYVQSQKSDNLSPSIAAYHDFVQALNEIKKITGGGLELTFERDLTSRDYHLSFVNDALLISVLHRFDVTAANSHDIYLGETTTNSPKYSLLDRLMYTIDDESTFNGENHKLLRKVSSILNTSSAFIDLAKEREKSTNEVNEFIPICTNKQHNDTLALIVEFKNHDMMSISATRLSQVESECPGLIDCLKKTRHFVPNIKPHTDISLGDCSYLDTCHKLNTCRYTHYSEYVSELLHKNSVAKTELINKIHSQQRGYPFFTHGVCCSSIVKKELPEQWIHCDVRAFDFTILGKFAAVIADPAWNIHMNLPYGTCNDNELLDLPFDKIQDEGIFCLWVTGRAIEMGKEYLKKWGYEVVHEISWIKTNQLNRTIVTGRTGHWLNHSKEQLLVGLKGNPDWLNRQLDPDIIVSATRETSRKPDELYGLLERIVGPHARKLEFFGRDHNLRPGWFTVGNQVSGTSIYEPDVKRRYDEFIRTRT